ncbi:MAG: MBL fold metallo-hydrolase [Candidatus Eremiobacteraeota bacterium]|nr:MBL fold metallo-hydrolase [Candidatus Eremiobacteraeota bacterium]
MISIDDELHIPGIGLWMDARRPRALCFISHAHSDHIAAHRRTIATKATAALCRKRLKHRRASDYEIRDFGESFGCGDSTVTLFPAGHVLGSSQIVVRSGESTTAYTGDFKLRGGRTHELCQVPRCDTLIMECTYGRPHYRFPQRAAVEAELIARCSAALDQKITPVVYAYALGKAQEVIAALSEAGFKVAAVTEVADVCEVYESLGVHLGSYARYDARADGRFVVVAPPAARRSAEVDHLIPRYEIAVTGWAVDRAMRSRLGVDCALAWSDHADFDDLISYVRQAAPKRVFCLHGFPDFVGYLKRAGIRAEWLAPSRQLQLFR